MIQIEGLSKGEMKLLDVMWSIDNVEVYEEWKSALSLELQNLVTSLEQLVLMEHREQELDPECKDAKQLLKRFALQR